jgi:hypothetical protein
VSVHEGEGSRTVDPQTIVRPPELKAVIQTLR